MTEPEELIDVVIVDDHTMFAQSLARLMDLEPGLRVVGVGSHGADAGRLVDQHRPRVLLLDFDMPDETGVEIARRVRVAHPDTMVVMVTGSSDDTTLLAAIEAGCSGFLTKDRAAADVATAVRAAAAGEALISPAQLARLLPRLTRGHRDSKDVVSERELQVLEMMATGSSNREIAAELFLSVNTVRNHVQSILTKLDAHSKLEAVAIAVRRGLISYPS